MFSKMGIPELLVNIFMTIMSARIRFDGELFNQIMD